MSNHSLIRDAYQQLLAIFEGGKVESLLFTSFNFSASFFENNILPLAAGCPMKEVGDMQAAQVNEVLENTQITVVCDRSTLPEPKSNYRYGQLAVGLKNAFFHPKIILATGTLEDGTPVAELIVGSCNLTLSGWGLNREVAGACTVGKQQADNLLPLVHWISKMAKAEVDRLNIDDRDIKEEGNVRQNLKSIETFLIENCQKEITLSPRFMLRLPDRRADKTYLELLTSGISQPIKSCRIVSPFWSNHENLKALIETLNSKHIDFVPSINHEGRYCFPSDMRDFLTESSFSNGYQGFVNNDRYTHAKSVSLVTKDTTHCFIGSANFTKAAMGNMKQGNVEAMLHYQLKDTTYIDAGFINLNGTTMNWADDSDADDQVPTVSSYVTHASYNWKTQIFICVLECSEDAFNHVERGLFNRNYLEFKKQIDGSYLTILKLSVKQPIYFMKILFTDNNEQCVYQGLVAQWNAEDDELIYSPKPQLSKIMDDLIALDPIKGPKRNAGSKGSISEPGEDEYEEERSFDFFTIYQAFYKQRKYFFEHPEKDPFNSSSVFSLSVMFRAINLEIDSRTPKSGEMNNEDVIYYFIFLSELASTVKELAANSEFGNANTLMDKIELTVWELETPFKILVSESRILKQFLHTESIGESTVDAILGWFKKQVDYTYE
ncbi:hypothetical protein [Moritella sp. Urea-trap-13]|uniref:hypothetical protein n=1 Tax=Moritella sp. Urea-trap-13 TaxID=2058327 RepID=UPI000C32C810|nr:hypothetical protein [Moritella sp. Urea-trap-13]PKH08183.1 hypothetical protein CXF93_05775 [Moritella sp. Urea-trap-13]